MGVFAAAQAGTIPYPMLPYGPDAHRSEIVDFMQGKALSKPCKTSKRLHRRREEKGFPKDLRAPGQGIDPRPGADPDAARGKPAEPCRSPRSCRHLAPGMPLEGGQRSLLDPAKGSAMKHKTFCSSYSSWQRADIYRRTVGFGCHAIFVRAARSGSDRDRERAFRLYRLNRD